MLFFPRARAQKPMPFARGPGAFTPKKRKSGRLETPFSDASYVFRLKLKASNRLNAPHLESRQFRLPYPAAKNDSIPRSVHSCNQAPRYPFSSNYRISHSPKGQIPRLAKPFGIFPSSSSIIVSWYQLTQAAHACAVSRRRAWMTDQRVSGNHSKYPDFPKFAFMIWFTCVAPT